MTSGAWTGAERRAFSREQSRLDVYFQEPAPAGDEPRDDHDDGDERLEPSEARSSEPARRQSTSALASLMPSYPAQQSVLATGDEQPELPSLTRVPEPDPEKLFQIDRIIDYVTFVGRAMLRHAFLVFCVFTFTLGGVAAATMMWPKSWGVGAKLLVRHNDVMSSLVNPGRTIPREKELTLAAEQLVMRRDNLVSIVHEANLLNEWERTRTLALKAKDRLFALFRPTPSKEDRVDALVGLLERDLHVNTEASGVINIWVFWRDPHLAADIVERAINNFLRDRKDTEVSAIADSIAILDRSARALEAQVGTTITELTGQSAPEPALTIEPTTDSPFVGPVPPLPHEVPGPPAEVTVKLARIKSVLDVQQQQLSQLESQRTGELTQAQAKLASALTVYTEGHPTVANLRQSVAALELPSADEQAALKSVQQLEHEHDTLSATVLAATEQGEEIKRSTALAAALLSPAPATTSAQVVDDVRLMSTTDSDPLNLRLQAELAQLASIRDRVSAARAELASSQAGFKYQYNVIRPPRAPLRPASPDATTWLTAGAVASLLLAMLAAVATDLAQGRIVEPWQVERLVGIPVAIRTADL